MTRGPRWRRLSICALAAALLYLPGLGRPALWEPDEGRYAEIGREMLVSGDYVTPRNDWVRYFEKPPLMYWATALSMAALGKSEFAARLPVALFSIGQVVVTAALAEAMFGAAAGLWAAACLATSPLFFGFARFLTLDPALAFFITAALAAFWAWARRADRDAAPAGWLLVAALALALGTLTKGPVAVALSGAIALAFVLTQRRTPLLGRVPWFLCAAVFIVVTAPWFFLVARRNPEFLGFFFVHEHLQRYLQSTEHNWGPWFFIPIVIGGAWPWIFFVPGAFMRRDRGRDAAERSALAFLVIWFVAVFVFFSISRSKLGSYILPAMPPLAILAGLGISGISDLAASTRRRIFTIYAVISNMVAAGVTVVVFTTGARRGLPISLGHDAIALSFALAAGSLAAWFLSRSANAPGPAAAIAMSIVFALVLMLKAQLDAEPLNSYRELARAVVPALRSGCVLASYRHHVQALPFYTESREALVAYRGEIAPMAATPDAAASFIADDEALARLWSSQSCVVVIVNRLDLPALQARLSPALKVIGSEGKKLAISNRPVP